MQTPTFRQLVDVVARHGLPVDTRPRSICSLAALCGLKRAHFYNLLRGHKHASTEAVIRIAQGFSTIFPVSIADIEASLDRTRTLKVERVTEASA
jgi:hypothetical protein